MHLKYCSITGADDAVNIGDLAALSAQYPFVEWAILLLPGQAGKPRFPKPEWIKSFSAAHRNSFRAMHLCGQALLDFIAGDAETLSLMAGFRRIQLNLNFGDMKGKYTPEKLVARVKESPQWEFIIQYGKDDAPLLPLLTNVPNHAVLFDTSAGRGISPDKWPAPLPDHFCGYAGGLSPENIQQNLKMMAEAAGDRTVWIDMESGVRTDDRFDLEKVRKVLAAAGPYLPAPWR